MSGQERTSPEKTASTVRLALWLTFFAFLLIVVVFRTSLSEIHFGNDGMSAKMVTTQEANKLSPGDRKAASDDLTQRINVLENQARTSAQNKPQDDPATPPVSNATYQQSAEPQQASIPNIAGTWSSPMGLVYQVTQYGNYVLISEMNQGVVEAAAAGPIAGWSFSLQAQTILNSTGVLALTVTPDQRHMNGQYRDNMTGQTVTIALNR